MRTLVIHPADKSTDFLKPIYASLQDATIFTGGISKRELLNLIESHDRIIGLGHGTPYGLMAVEQFLDAGFYIIDDSFIDVLSKKKDNIFIWCHASDFMKNNQLSGFGTGMFISEIEEALFYDFWDVPQNMIDKSNNHFAYIMSKYINQPLHILYENVLHEYGNLARTNPITEFNANRIFLNMNKNHSVINEFRG